MNSILSFPDRGPWGDAKWRGNASGHVYRELFTQLAPRTFVDPMVGSGTSVQVAQEMGIKCWGLDLHSGHNAIRHSILQTVGQEVDLCVSHPPYGSMIQYSGNVWGNRPHADDLSRCVDDSDFHEKMHLVLLNQRDATRDGGYYGTLIGDWRRGGQYTSYQAEMLCRMPRDELAAVIIKVQHNCMSNAKSYGRMKLPMLVHEYLILWEKRAKPMLLLLRDMAKVQQERLTGTWKSIVRLALVRLNGGAPLDAIYREVSASAPDKLASNPNWQAKIRQTLNTGAGIFVSPERGVWSLA